MAACCDKPRRDHADVAQRRNGSAANSVHVRSRIRQGPVKASI